MKSIARRLLGNPARIVAGAMIVITFGAGCSAVADVGGAAGMTNYNNGVNHQGTKQSTLAEQDYKLALQQNPSLAEAHLNLGIMYMDTQWWDDAEEETKQAVALFEKTKTTLVAGATWQQSLSIAYNNLGVIEMSRAQGFDASRNSTQARSHWQAG